MAAASPSRHPPTANGGGIQHFKGARRIPAADTSVIQFLPGQWLDVFVPGISKPGGFTITSPPSKARIAAAGAAGGSGDDAMDPASSPPPPYLELAVQKSPENVVAQWLWQPADAILSSELHVRVGGSFVWPPPGVMPMVGLSLRLRLQYLPSRLVSTLPLCQLSIRHAPSWSNP